MGYEVVLLWLAQGAFQYIGGKVLSSIVGDPMLSNIDSIVRSAVAEIKAYTSRAIEENEIRKLVASMDSVLTNLRNYALLTEAKDQAANQFLLTDAIIKTGDAMAQCKSLGIPAIGCYAHSVSLSLIARVAFHNLTETDASASLLKATVSDATATINQLVPPYEASLSSGARIAPANPPCTFHRVDDFNTEGKCWVLVDGQNKQVYDGLGPIYQGDYQAFIDAEVSAAVAEQAQAIKMVVTPIRQAQIEWEKVSAPMTLFLEARKA